MLGLREEIGREGDREDWSTMSPSRSIRRNLVEDLLQLGGDTLKASLLLPFTLQMSFFLRPVIKIGSYTAW